MLSSVKPPIIPRATRGSQSHLPTVLTFRLSSPLMQILEPLRQRYFPEHLNHLPAHLTMFHAFPRHLNDDISHTLRQLSSQTSPTAVRLERQPILFGGEKTPRGVAVPIVELGSLDGDRLVGFRKKLQGIWWDHLTNQDRRKMKPHVTVCNKVSSEEATKCMRDMIASIEEESTEEDGGVKLKPEISLPRDDVLGEVEGVDVWAYIGPHWEWREYYGFIKELP